MLCSPLEAARIIDAGGTVVAGRVLGMLQVSRSLGDVRFKGSGVTAEPELVRYVLRSGTPERRSSSGTSGEGNGGDFASEAESEVPFSMPVDLDLDLGSDGDDDAAAAATAAATPVDRQLRRCETTASVGATVDAQTRTGDAGECRTVVAEDAAARDEFVVIASDGLWGVMSNADVVRFVHQHTRGLALASEPLDVLQSCANDLVQEALVRGSRDNITATILFFAPPSSSPAAAPATATATTATPGALAVLASPPRTRPDSLRRCCSATFSSETDVPSSSSDDRTTQHR